MENTFKQDCMQFNPHLNYLKIPPLLKYSLLSLIQNIQSLSCFVSIDQFDEKNDLEIQQLIEMEGGDTDMYKNIVKALIAFLECLDKLEHTCLTFIELKLIEKYFKQNLLKEEMFETLVKFGTICLLHVANLLANVHMTRYDIEISFKCADLIFKNKCLWTTINNSEKYFKHVEVMVNVLYKTIKVHIDKTNIMSKFEIENLGINTTNDIDRKAVFLAKFVEIRSQKEDLCGYFKLEEIVIGVIISVLRTNQFYVFAIAPIEILRFDLDISKSKLTAVPSIPIEYLNEAEILQLFVKRLII